MEINLTSEFIKIMNRMRKLKFNNHMKNKVHNAEGMMLFMIFDYYDYEEEGIKKSLMASELAEIMCMSKSAVSKMLNVLEGKKLAERYMDNEDRRVVYVRLTGQGEEYVKKAKRSMEVFTEKIMNKLGREDLETLIRVLGHLYEIMKEEAGQYKE